MNYSHEEVENKIHKNYLITYTLGTTACIKVHLNIYPTSVIKLPIKKMKSFFFFKKISISIALANSLTIASLRTSNIHLQGETKSYLNHFRFFSVIKNTFLTATQLKSAYKMKSLQDTGS